MRKRIVRRTPRSGALCCRRQSGAIGGQVQAEIDQLAELAQIGAAAGNQGTASGGIAQPGGIEGEPNPAPPKGKTK
jgi:hypothetical protein